MKMLTPVGKPGLLRYTVCNFRTDFEKFLINCLVNIYIYIMSENSEKPKIAAANLLLMSKQPPKIKRDSV